MATDQKRFRVIITGGGIAGLTLANSLERANIDYLLLEARNDVAPPAGASIAIGANGGRILDQIGALGEVLRASTPSDIAVSYKDGKEFDSNDFLRLNHARTGYSLNFLNRQSLLQILYQSLPNKANILVNKRVSRLDCRQDGVVVQCKDGTSYEGSVVVGADGVHSMVRQEMWRHMELECPGAVSDKEKHKMIAEYSCMYGVSNPVNGLSQGCLYKIYGEGVSFLTAVGKQDQVFWFIFQKLDKTYTVPNIPRFTSQDAATQALKLLSRPITDKVFFKDIWEQRTSYTLTPLEEAFFSKWTWGRLACVGDSAHKWTPNIGQGGNNAIESAAALANTLHTLVNKQAKESLPSYEGVVKSLEAFQSHRQARAEATFEVACKVTRFEAMKSLADKLLSLYFFPNSGELLANKISSSMMGSEKLDFLPEPQRSFMGTMAFNQNYGIGHEDKMLKRAMLALPLLLIGYLCHTSIQAVKPRPSVISLLSSRPTNGNPDLGSGQRLDQATYYGDMMGLLTVLGPVFLICLLESHRRANAFTLVRFPILFGIGAQLFGIGSIGPLYLFFHYIQSPVSKFAAFDHRLINVAAARTALPALMLACGLHSLATQYAPELSKRFYLTATLPLWLSVTHYLLSKFSVRDTTEHDRIYKPSTDLPHIRFATRTLATASALIFNWARWHSLLLGNGFPLDQVSCVLACFIWLALLFKDLKDVGIARLSWMKMVLYAMLTTIVCGPGTVIAMGWLWREELLATKRADGAVVRMVDD